MKTQEIPKERIISHIGLRLEIDDFSGLNEALKVADDYLGRNQHDWLFRRQVEILCESVILPQGRYHNFKYRSKP
ncbi:hypothetical protein HYU09_04380 [Candidatus Woesearchaeota archaeon]|nr:hypothetical protein [Candidatus Woesearchaeota archaeon]